MTNLLKLIFLTSRRTQNQHNNQFLYNIRHIQKKSEKSQLKFLRILKISGQND